MFVYGHAFLVTTSFNIKSSSIMNMQGNVGTEALNGIKKTISAFTARKINIETIVGDNKFEASHKSLRPAHVEIVGADEHEGHVERFINTVKEHTRCYFQKIPYKQGPELMW